MKKTRRLVLLVIGVAALSAGSIGYSNAKYRKEVNLPDTARLANWAIEPTALSGNLELFSGSYTTAGKYAGSDAAPTAAPIGHSASKIVAPGAQGSTQINFSALDTADATEVAYQINFVTASAAITGIDSTLGDALKGRITYSVTKQNGDAISSGTLASFATDMASKSIPANEIITVSWAWPLDSGNDGQDTQIADLVDGGANINLVVTLAYQAVQID